MNSEAGLIFRTANPDDISFIHSSWANSYYSGTVAQKLLNPEEFHNFHRPLRDRVLARSSTQAIVCTPDDDAWHIMGWIITESTPSAIILHYVYVKSDFRGRDFGIAKSLVKRAIKTAPVVYTHLTERAAKILARKPENYSAWKFVPHVN